MGYFMVNCTNCGFYAEDSKFCPNCGSEMIVDEEKNKCPNCGSDVGDSAFCSSCGTKIEKEVPKSFCPNCGADVGDSAFCSSCGTKIGTQQVNSCPSCGKFLNESSKFCPYCGWGDSETQSDSALDKVVNLEEKFAVRMGKRMSKSRTSDAIINIASPIRRKNKLDSASRKLYEKTEPVFLEVYDSIDDKYLASIFLLERTKHNNQGGGVIGIVATSLKTPTSDMSHDEAVKYYVDIVRKLHNEINHEKQIGNFDEDEFYKKKLKESTFENQTSLTGLKFLKKS